MQLTDIRRRVKRLERLGMGLAKESSIMREADAPLLYRERKQYLQGIHQAHSGVEAARVVLARAAQRLEGVKPTGHLPKRK
jgi:hypothetical protein